MTKKIVAIMCALNAVMGLILGACGVLVAYGYYWAIVPMVVAGVNAHAMIVGTAFVDAEGRKWLAEEV